MEKQTYLSALGISTWKRRPLGPIPTILSDHPAELVNQPLVSSVLALLGYDESQCQFTDKPRKQDLVLWDLRKVAIPKKAGVIYSAPFASLLSHSEAKQMLWRNIWQAKESVK